MVMNPICWHSGVVSSYQITYKARTIKKGHAIALLLAYFPRRDISYKEQESIEAMMVAIIVPNEEIP